MKKFPPLNPGTARILRPATALIISAVVLAAGVRAQLPPPTNRFIAVFEINANVDGESYAKGFQAFAVRYERAAGKVYIDDKGRIVAVPAKFVRLIPEEKAGISIISAEYRLPGQRAKNVTAFLQRKFNGHQKVTLIVSGSLFGIRSTDVPFAPPLEGLPQKTGPGTAVQSVKSAAPAMNFPQNPLGYGVAQLPATLDVTFAYKGLVSSVAAPEGQPITMP